MISKIFADQRPTQNAQEFDIGLFDVQNFRRPMPNRKSPAKGIEPLNLSVTAKLAVPTGSKSPAKSLAHSQKEN
jgi:hypothetical protein